MDLATTMHDHEAVRLAAAINSLRPDWPVSSLHTFIIRNLAARAYADAAVALTFVAVDPKSSTPKRVLEAGPWWRATQTEAGTYRPPRKDEVCPVHVGSWANSCSGCAADRLSGDTTQGPDPRKPVVTARVAEVRAELATIKAALCGHKVDRTRAHCDACERPAEPATEATE